MRSTFLRAIGTTLFACAFFAAFANASDVAGPTYPLPNNSGLVTGNGGSIGRTNGFTWTFASATPTAQQLLFWGPATKGVQLSFNSAGFSGAGDTLTFNAGLSNLPGGKAIFTGNTNFLDGTPVQSRFTMTYISAGNPAPLTLASSLNRDATVGALLKLTTPANGFSVNMEFDVNVGSGFQPALDAFDTHVINNHEPPQSAFSSITAGYYTATPPVISNITPPQIFAQESAGGSATFQVSDAETAAANLTVTAASDTQSVLPDGNITVSGSGANRSVSIVTTTQGGTANITLTVFDGLQSSTAVIPVVVNKPPVLTFNNPLNIVQSTTATITSALLTAVDPDTSNPPIFAVVNPTHDGTLLLNGSPNFSFFTQADVDAGHLTYAQSGDCGTSDNFGFTVEDSGGAFANDDGHTEFDFDINITNATTAPTAQPASYSVALGGTVTASLVATTTDCSKPPRTFQVVSQPTNGILSVNPNSGVFTYTANPGYSGPDSFTFTATTYGTLVSAPATISFDIETQAPVAQSASINPNENTPFNGTLVATDANLPTLALTYSLGALPTKGVVVLNDASSGSFTYTPNAGAIGADSFTFTANNGTLTSSPATITISIRGILHSGEVVVGDVGNGSTIPASLVLFDPVTQQQAQISSDPLLSSGHQGVMQVAIGADGKILVSANDQIVKVDPADGSAIVFAKGFTFALGIAVEADGNVLVADPGAAAIVRLDGTTGTIIGMLSFGSTIAPGGIAIADDTTLYVSNVAGVFSNGAESNSVLHLNADGSNVTTLTSDGNLSAPLGITLDGGNLYISNASFGPGGTNDVIQIDTTTGAQTVVTAGNLIDNASGITSDATQLYVVSQNTAAIIGVDPTTHDQTSLTSGGYLDVPFAIASVPLRATITSIMSETPDPSVPGNGYDVSVTVKPTAGSGTPTGTVNVDDGLGATCTITLANGSGSCTLVSAAPGSVTITASYTGDSVFAASVTTQSHLVGPYLTTTIITSTAPSVVGQSYAINVSVTAPVGMPDGSITVSDDAAIPNTCGPITLSSGTATCNIAWSVPGSYTLTATFTPTTPTQYAASSGAQTHVVNRGDATVTVTPPTGSVTIDAPYTVNVSVAAKSPAVGTPTGAVIVDDGSGDTCSIASLDIAGAGSCQLTPTSAGGKTITATYSGDADFNAANGTASLTVQQATSTTTLASNTNPSTYGQSVTFTATVTGLAPTGSVAFKDGGIAIPGCGAASFTGGTTNSPTATCTTTSLSVATHSITAQYSSDASNSASASTVLSQVVNRATTTTTLSTACMTEFVQDQPFTLTAAVTTATSGGVTFSNGTTVLCSNVALSAGKASCTVSNLRVTGSAKESTYVLTANYLGNANDAPSGPASLTVTVLSGGDVIFRNGFEAESLLCPIE